MRRGALLLGLTLSLLAAGCKRDSVSRKFMDGLPMGDQTTVVSVRAAQEFHLLIDRMMDVSVAVMKRTAITNITITYPDGYPELEPGGGPTYQFIVNEDHFGQATFNMTFRDGSNATIDPVALQGSTTAIKSILITETGSSSFFNSSANLVLTLATAGDVNSDVTVTGTLTLIGTNYNLSFAFPAGGASASFSGLFAGLISATGTGNSQSATIDLTYNSFREANGALTWEGQEGQIHVKHNGSVILVTDQERIVFD